MQPYRTSKRKALASLYRLIDRPLFLSQVNQSYLTSSEELLYNQIKKILDAMEHYYSLGEINLAIQETDSLHALLKTADYRINETFLLQVSLKQLVMNLVFRRVFFNHLVNIKHKKADRPLKIRPNERNIGGRNMLRHVGCC